MATPANINFLSPSGFTLAVEKLPTTTFFAQSVTLPSVKFGSTYQGTPNLDIAIMGDKLEFDDLAIDFMVDEDMRNYKEILAWMFGIGHPESLDQYATFHELESTRLFANYNPRNHTSMYSDATLSIMTNSSTPNNNNIYFTDLFPVGLGGLDFMTTINDVQYLTCRANFRYSDFKFV